VRERRRDVAEFRLNDPAANKLIEIYDFTETTFGRYQADAYHAGFERTFGLLADFPRMGTDVSELKVGYRRFRFQSHVILYTEEVYGVLIRDIFHSRQDLRKALIE
jgi:toxin ParE1/3/4